MRIEAKQVAEIYKLNDNGRSAQKWAKDGNLKALKDGKKWLYEIDDVIQFGYENGYIKISMNEKDKLAPKVRKDLADAELKEFRLGIEQGKYYTKDEIHKYIEFFLINTRNRVLRMGSKLAPYLINIDDPYKAEEIVYQECYDTLTELAKMEDTTDVLDRRREANNDN